MVANNPVPDLDNLPVGTVMRSTRVINGKQYTYISLKAPSNNWYVTGMKGFRSNSEMRRWLRHAVFSEPHVIATTWTDIAYFTSKAKADPHD